VASHLTRKALLKQDKFAVEVEHTVDYFAAHRQQAVRYGGIAVAVALIIAAVFYFRTSQKTVRQQVLGEGIALVSAPIAATPPAGGGPSFPNTKAKDDAVTKAFTKITTDYSGSDEAYIAEYFLAGRSVDAGKLDDARKKYQDVADHADSNYASLAKLSLAQINIAENRNAEAESQLKDLMDHPTDLVSKTQASIAYAKAIAPKRPDEARKLLTQIASTPSDISQIATQALTDLDAK
jgi:predicted negative regulator of RcsB-dependent stress response